MTATTTMASTPLETLKANMEKLLSLATSISPIKVPKTAIGGSPGRGERKRVRVIYDLVFTFLIPF